MNKKIIIGSVILITLIALLAGCIDNPSKGERAKMLDTQPTETLKQSNERKIFQGYLDQVNNPNNIQFIYLFDFNGHVLFRGTVMGKAISATKSTEPYDRVAYDGSNTWETDYAQKNFAGFIQGTTNLMNPSGMFGHDTPGVIWMDPQGNYHEWHNGPYLITSYPVKLKEPVLSFSDVDKEMEQKINTMKQKLASGNNLTQEEKDYLMNN